MRGGPAAGAAALALFVGNATATQFHLAPRDLGAGYRLMGSITTDGTLGALGGANLMAWNLRVTESA